MHAQCIIFVSILISKAIQEEIVAESVKIDNPPDDEGANDKTERTGLIPSPGNYGNPEGENQPGNAGDAENFDDPGNADNLDPGNVDDQGNFVDPGNSDDPEKADDQENIDDQIEDVDDGVYSYVDDQEFSNIMKTINKEPGFDLSNSEIRKLKLWPDGFIPYYIDVHSFSDKVMRDKIRSFLSSVNSLTALNFVEMPSPPADNSRWVFFVNRRGLLGCADHSIRNFTNVGVQQVVLGYHCMNTEGELAEAVLSIAGVPAMHNAPDRDYYIQIREENIIPEKKYLFDKVYDDEWLFHDLEYDFHSAGHFHSYKYSANGQATIIPQKKLGLREMTYGESTVLSATDITKLRMLYNFIVKQKTFVAPDCLKLFEPGENFDGYKPIVPIAPRRKPRQFTGESPDAPLHPEEPVVIEDILPPEYEDIQNDIVTQEPYENNNNNNNNDNDNDDDYDDGNFIESDEPSDVEQPILNPSTPFPKHGYPPFDFDLDKIDFPKSPQFPQSPQSPQIPQEPDESQYMSPKEFHNDDIDGRTPKIVHIAPKKEYTNAPIVKLFGKPKTNKNENMPDPLTIFSDYKTDEEMYNPKRKLKGKPTSNNQQVSLKFKTFG